MENGIWKRPILILCLAQQTCFVRMEFVLFDVLTYFTGPYIGNEMGAVHVIEDRWLLLIRYLGYCRYY